MMDTIAASKSRRFGVVTTPAFMSRPGETLTERTLADFSAPPPTIPTDGLLTPEKVFRRDAQGREVYHPKTRVFTRIGCISEIYEEPTRFDDGRYIVENRGITPFRIVDIVQEEPYLVAVVQLLKDAPVVEDSLNQELRQSEIDSWQALNDVCWLACELFDKRSWLPLLMELDGKLHPLSKMKHEAPEERQAGVPPVLTRAAAAANWAKRQRFSWELVRVLRQGVPGLWDIEFTGSKLSDTAVLKMMQDLDFPSRLALAEKELKKARYLMRQHQRLRDIAHNRDDPPKGFS
mmetsp:Transcript_81680/g.132398  ORF Transcript_81680/g.132398 Transcript_81680/m.132398 type:complete len:291 (+) Transcript_81680:781-1653(+)